MPERATATPLSTSTGGGTGTPAHAPAWHESESVHAFPSVHDVPFGAAGFEQSPVPVSQGPATWHWSVGEETTGVGTAQTLGCKLLAWEQGVTTANEHHAVSVGYA